MQCGRASPQVSKFRGSSGGPKARFTREGHNLVSKNECKCKRGVRECHGRVVVMPSHRIGWHTPDQACSANKEEHKPIEGQTMVWTVIRTLPDQSLRLRIHIKGKGNGN